MSNTPRTSNHILPKLRERCAHSSTPQLWREELLALIECAEVLDELGKWKADAPPELLQRAGLALAKVGLRP